MKTDLLTIFTTLFRQFGPQGWWPAKTRNAKWEMCVGAILTQNTAWKNVDRVLDNLIAADVLSVEKIADMPLPRLERLIKPSGFYKQKAVRLRDFAKFVLKFGGIDKFCKNVTADELLTQRGIGPETAYSILLYACNKPYFVIDAYTQRIFTRLGMTPEEDNYEGWRLLFESNLPKDVKLYKEYHALIVELAKRNCLKNEECGDCVLRKMC
ncbi:MAG: endonuclease [Candidatus Aenigmatarchaeota archaeon]